MKRVLKYLIAGILLGALVVCLGGAAWLVGTTQGARGLLSAVSRFTDLTLSAKTVHGQLAGTLTLDGLSISWPQGHVLIEQTRITTRPLAILTGRLSLQALILKNITFTDSSPEKKPDLTWPRAPGWIAWWSADIQKLEIEQFVYHSPGKPPLQLRQISASVLWRNAQLSAADIRIASADGTLSGNILAGFSRPLLEMNIAALLSDPQAGMEFFRISGKFTPGKSPEQIAGSLYFSGSRTPRDAKPLWELSLDAAMTPQGFPLRGIRLVLPEKSGLVTGEGMLTFKDTEPFLTLEAETANIDLSFLTGMQAKMAGGIIFRGTPRQYEGTIRLSHSGKNRPSIRMTGNYAGDSEKAALDDIRGETLGGTISGRLDIDWRQGISISGEMAGRRLNPADLDPGFPGEVNFDLTGRFSAPKNGPMSGDVVFALKESLLHDRELTGDLHASFISDDIRVRRLSLRGKGFELYAAGAIHDKLNFIARANDLSRLLPETSGSLAAQGWVRRREGKISGVISAGAADLVLDDLKIAAANLSASLTEGDKKPLGLHLTLRKLRYRGFGADTFTMKAGGTLQSHTVSAALRKGGAQANLEAAGSHDQNQWQGKISRLNGTDKAGRWHLVLPAGIVITANRFTLDSLLIAGANTERLKASCHLTFAPLTGALDVDWTDINLGRTSAWLKQDVATGLSSGQVHMSLLPQERLIANGRASLRGTLYVEGKAVAIREGALTLDAGEQGMRADASLLLTEGGKLRGDFSSSQPAELAVPEEGRFNLTLQEFDAALLLPLLPESLKIEGKITGRAEGSLGPGQQITMTGNASAASSKVILTGPKGEIRIDLRQVLLDWLWRGETLSGALALTLAEYGKLEGKFRLPITARLPVVIDEQKELTASLTGQVREKGALGILFPQLVQESRGDLDIDLKLGGSIAALRPGGTIRLSKAGGYLPAAGITIKEAGLNARFDADAVFIDSFRAVSGPGHVEGSGIIRLQGREIKSFEGRLEGERFQTIYFPELQVQSSPKLTFSGIPQKLLVRGEILLPVIQIVGTESQGPIEASPDVIREGREKQAARKLPFDLDARIKIILGDAVSFNAAGINAQMGGSLDLQFQEIEKIISSGEIRVVKGSFRTYGVNLNIVRGRLYYAANPVNQPSLDILALKTVGEVKAGVAVSGTLQAPLIKLYSEPAMQDMDILAYIVLGHPLGRNTDQAALLALAARALLTSKQAEDLQGQIKGRLGLGSFEISTGVVDQNGKMGYKPIKTSPAGALPASSESVSETMVVVGRYLTPNLYVSFGRSLFTGANLLFLRYNLTKDWQVESQTGRESGVDIYYKLEFN